VKFTSELRGAIVNNWITQSYLPSDTGDRPAFTPTGQICVLLGCKVGACCCSCGCRGYGCRGYLLQCQLMSDEDLQLIIASNRQICRPSVHSPVYRSSSLQPLSRQLFDASKYRCAAAVGRSSGAQSTGAHDNSQIYYIH